MKDFRSFLVRLLIFSAFTHLLIFAWVKLLPARFQTSSLVLVWGFFVLTTALIHYILSKAAERDPKKFVGYFMGITAVKLFGYLLVIIAYAMIRKEGALGFILWFLVMYLFYTVFEVIMLMRHLKK
jgi:hypothetical protein